MFLYLIYSSIYIGLNVWLIVSLGLGPKLLITTTLLIVIFLTRDLKSKILLDDDTFYYEALIRKRSYPIKDIAQIVKGREKANGIGGSADYFYVRDKHLNDIFVLPESLPEKRHWRNLII